MDDRVLWAAENNARWCALVCRSHGIPSAMRPGLWVALRRAPELYPDAVTLRPEVAAGEVLRSAPVGPGCSVKDSFAALGLGPLGFHELFHAQWVFREAEIAGRRSSLSWSAVKTEDELGEWTRAAGLTDIVRGELLRDSSVSILAVRGPDGISAGAVANRTGSVVGVSNVFSVSIAADEVWASIAGAVATVFPPLALVGYEHGESLVAALASGFTGIGPLRIWLRS